MKVKIKSTGEIVEITEVLVDVSECASPQRVDIKEVEFLPEEFIKYLTD